MKSIFDERRVHEHREKYFVLLWLSADKLIMLLEVICLKWHYLNHHAICVPLSCRQESCLMKIPHHFLRSCHRHSRPSNNSWVPLCDSHDDDDVFLHWRSSLPVKLQVFLSLWLSPRLSYLININCIVIKSTNERQMYLQSENMHWVFRRKVTMFPTSSVYFLHFFHEKMKGNFCVRHESLFPSALILL